MLELLHFAGEGAKPAPVPTRAPMNEIGLTHISLSVDDIPATCALVEQHGGEVLRDTSSAARRSSCAIPTASSSSCSRWRTPSDVAAEG